MDQFERDLIKVQAGLLFCMHITSRPPSRGPEILSIRHRNTWSSGLRNIGVEDGLMFFALRTHKNIKQFGKEKVVHHFLSREVGELLMYWLWIVLLCWEQMRISIDLSNCPSPFL